MPRRNARSPSYTWWRLNKTIIEKWGRVDVHVPPPALYNDCTEAIEAALSKREQETQS